MNQIERWRKTSDYMVSTHGRVRKGHRFLSQVRRNGYPTVALYDQQRGKCRLEYVHRLVAKLFLERRPDQQQVNHIDFDRTNNHVSNLEWCTNKENCQHTSRAGRTYRRTTGERFNVKLTEAQVRYIRRVFGRKRLRGRSIAAGLAAKFGVHQSTIYLARNGNRNWKHVD